MAQQGSAPPRSRLRLWLGLIGLASTLLVVLLATLWPTPLDQGYEGAVNRFMSVLYRSGVPLWFGYNKLEFTANIIMFVPIGFLVSLLLPQRIWWLAIIICPAFSVGIEMTQATFLSARFATPLDVASNSIGALIGITVAMILRSLVYQRDQLIISRALWERGLRP